MTYYEWINYFDNLKNKPISDDIINFINNSNITYQGNIRVRYLNHIVALINYRLNDALDKFIIKNKALNQDKDTIAIELSDLKKEIEIAKKLASIRHFEENTKNELLKNIKLFGEEMNSTIKTIFSNCKNNEILILINNFDFN